MHGYNMGWSGRVITVVVTVVVVVVDSIASGGEHATGGKLSQEAKQVGGWLKHKFLKGLVIHPHPVPVQPFVFDTLEVNTRDVASGAKDYMSEKAKAAKEKAEERAREASKKATEKAQEGKEAAQEATKETLKEAQNGKDEAQQHIGTTSQKAKEAQESMDREEENSWAKEKIKDVLRSTKDKIMGPPRGDVEL